MAKQHERLLAYGLYTSSIDAIKHFEILQTSYRIMASRLLLATFAAIGFILSIEIKTLPFDRLIAVILICAISSGAITTIWHLDLAFMERLSTSVFVECLKMEEKHPWLTQVHHNMLVDGSHASCPSKKVLFYEGSLLLVLLAMGIAATMYAKSLGTLIWIPVLIGSLLVIFFYLLLIKKLTKSFPQLRRELEANKNVR
ncbi:MAG: hypothetical protein JSS60_09690 [Verrucomicrobia bacterium]|nr:hypothetical protein [Verrucomicrobiota bacterium]